MYVLGWIVMVLLAAGVAYVVGLMRRPEPVSESRTFGLEEARAARSFIQTPEQAKAVKAVVVGVLGYEDTVAEEAEDEAEELLQSKGSNERRSGVFQDDITALRAKIAALEAANVSIDTHRADLAALKDLFA